MPLIQTAMQSACILGEHENKMGILFYSWLNIKNCITRRLAD